MKTKICSGLIALSAATLLTGPVWAQSATTPGAAPARRAVSDTDGDGKISQAEFVQARTARLAALDADHDGTVTRAEVEARVQAVRARRADARFERLDADKNGQISRAEFDAPRAPTASGQAGRGGHRLARRSGAPIQRIAARQPLAIAEVQRRATETFARLDTDHDGFLTPAERSAGQVERRARHRSRPLAPATPASPSTPASE